MAGVIPSPILVVYFIFLLFCSSSTLTYLPKGTHYGRGHWVHFFSLFWPIFQEESTTAGAITWWFISDFSYFVSLYFGRNALWQGVNPLNIRSVLRHSRLTIFSPSLAERLTAGVTIFAKHFGIPLMAGVISPLLLVVSIRSALEGTHYGRGNYFRKFLSISFLTLYYGDDR